VSRSQWRADETKRDPHAHYAQGVAAIFIHHTDTPNNYRCADVPRTLRNLYTGQTRDRNWGDLGYNFLVDRCGNIYEGRAGGTDRPVIGSHAIGFNQGTVGIAAIGTFGQGTPVPAAMERGIAALAAWKLGLRGIDPTSKVRLTSVTPRGLRPHSTRSPAIATALPPTAQGRRCSPDSPRSAASPPNSRAGLDRLPSVPPPR
jgi:hypothetical protein